MAWSRFENNIGKEFHEVVIFSLYLLFYDETSWHFYIAQLTEYYLPAYPPASLPICPSAFLLLTQIRDKKCPRYGWRLIRGLNVVMSVFYFLFQASFWIIFTFYFLASTAEQRAFFTPDTLDLNITLLSRYHFEEPWHPFPKKKCFKE